MSSVKVFLPRCHHQYQDEDVGSNEALQPPLLLPVDGIDESHDAIVHCHISIWGYLCSQRDVVVSGGVVRDRWVLLVPYLEYMW